MNTFLPQRFSLNIGLAVLSAITLFAACMIGATSIAPQRVFTALLGSGLEVDRIIVWSIRLPRALAAYLVGASLGMAGGALQGLFRNPLAEPGVIGVSATSSLFAAGALYYGIVSWSPLTLPIAAIIGALAATAIVAIAARLTNSVVALILVGVGLSSFAGALMALLMNLAPHPFTLSDMINWTMGSVANRSFEDIALTAPFMAMGAAILIAHARGLSLLTLGEEAAVGAGLDLQRQRLAVIIGAGFAAGGSVALAGAVGFVGIVAPHFIRRFVDHDPQRTLLPSALLGGWILLMADILVRVVPTNSELKLGVAAALIGAPVFIWIAANRGGRA